MRHSHRPKVLLEVQALPFLAGHVTNPADAPAFDAIANGDFSEEPQKLSLDLHGTHGSAGLDSSAALVTSPVVRKNSCWLKLPVNQRLPARNAELM
jgi:hypothetical protein